VVLRLATDAYKAMIETVVELAYRAIRIAANGAAGRLVRRRDGGATVEFGLVAVPFVALLFAIVEKAVVFFPGQAL
jgi:Flp pilus assembly protein TadG